MFQILREKRDVNFLIRLPKPFGLSNKWIKTNLKHQKPQFYSRLFDESEHGPFEVPPGLAKTYDNLLMIKLLMIILKMKLNPR